MITQLEPLFDRTIDCIHCKQKFTSKNVRSKFVKVKSYDTDFCPHYTSEDANPILYTPYVCPHCGFSFTGDFSKYFPPHIAVEIQTKVSDNWVPQDYGQIRTIDQAINAYKLTVYCATLKKEKHISIGGLYMRIAWLYRSKGSEEHEHRFLKLSLQQYLDSYSTDDFRGTQVSDVKLLYLLGDIYRRVGDIEHAVLYFSKVIEKKSSTVETGIVDMARERWMDIREQQKSQNE